MENLFSELLFEEPKISTSAGSPFMNRKVVIDGNLGKYSKEAIKNLVLKLGGEVVSTDVTKSVNFYIVGNSPSGNKWNSYIKQVYNGFQIKQLNESDIDKIADGIYEGYFVPDENEKNLHLTMEHYNNNQIEYKAIVKEPNGHEYLPNPFYGKEIYLGSCIAGDKLKLSQMFGLIGAFSGCGLNDNTQIVIISDDAFLALENGEEHQELIHIQNTYNRGLANWFTYKLTTERQFFAWFQSRFELYKDNVCRNLYFEYLKSK